MASVSEKHFCAEGPGGEGEARLQSRQPQQSNRPGAKLSENLAQMGVKWTPLAGGPLNFT